MRICCVEVALCIPVFTGCGDAPAPGHVEAKGRVTYEGQPLEGASVIFQRTDTNESTLASQALTDAEGRFELRTYGGGEKFTRGIAPGQYGVAISKLDTAAVASTFSPPKNMLPAKYADPKKSGLTADVAEGKANDFEFELKSGE